MRVHCPFVDAGRSGANVAAGVKFVWVSAPVGLD